MRKIKKIFMRGPIYAIELFYLLLFYAIGFFARLTPKYRNVWIVSERGGDARDNGYCFYKYVRENHPEINAYYIIDKNSADFSKVAELGGAVNYRGFKHRLLFAVAEYKISSHVYGYSPDILCCKLFQKMGLVRGKLVFLQHGIIISDMKWMFYPEVRLDLFVCGAKPEYEAIKARFGFPPDVVKYLGLCRYDALADAESRRRRGRILLMPSWRVYICEVGARVSFTKSEYYRRFQSLINNPRLHEFLEESDCELVFYPHFEVQRFLDKFSSKSGRVTIASFKDYDVQELLMSSELLITDYSSVFFDFAYMDKPLVYYQFDEAEFRANHYSRGYFDYRRDGFGPAFAGEDEVVDYVIKKSGDGFVPDKVYKDRADKFFELRDRNNCKRNFEAVISI